MRENRDQQNYRHGHFSRIVIPAHPLPDWISYFWKTLSVLPLLFITQQKIASVEVSFSGLMGKLNSLLQQNTNNASMHT